MTTSVTYIVSYLGQGQSLQPYEQRNLNYLIPFSYNSVDQLVVTINGQRTTAYSAYGPQLILDKRPADNSEIRIYRNTELQAEPTDVGAMARFTPGHPVKASDLNDNYSWLVQRIEELETLVKSQAYLSDFPPSDDVAWTGMTWVNTNTWTVRVFDGSVWVEVSPQSKL